MALTLEGLHKFDQKFHTYSHELLQTLVCNSYIEFSWNCIFESCKDALLFKGLYSLNK